MTNLDQALSFAQRGFYVFPLRANGNKPSHTGWQQEATRDETQIRKWFTNRKFNVGIFTGRYADGQALCVVDVDIKKGKRGDKSLVQLELEGNEFPQTLEHRTPSGGWHLIYACDQPLRQGADVLGSGLDIRSRGGYIVAPGSEIDGKAYSQINGHSRLAGAPDWLCARLGVDAGRRLDPVPAVVAVDPDRAEVRAREYLSRAPLAVEGQHGDQTTYVVAARLKDLGCGRDQAIWLMDECWNDRCTPPWSLADLADKADHAYKYGREVPGSSAPEAVFPPVEDPGPEDEELHPLERMNRANAFVLVGSTGWILWETKDEHGAATTELLQVQAFHQLHASEMFQVSSKKSEPLTKAWMSWPERRTYQRLCFAPGETLPPDFFNLWRGFAVQPVPGDWSLLRAHIQDVICSGNSKIFRYVMGWLALAVQQPGRRAEVALVLKGGRGVGKGILGNAMCRIFGRHGLHLTNAKHMVGNFNGHLRESAYMFADEAFWAGDKQHEGVLKGLVTEPEFALEQKHKDAVMWPNRLHILMASNEDWVVPAGVDERRFCVLEVPASRRGNFKYFKAIVSQMEAGGHEAMLHDLLAWDLTDFEVREVPTTAALIEQKHASLAPQPQWWLNCLMAGELLGGDWAGEWPETIPTNRLRAAFSRWAEARNIHSRLPEEIAFGRILKTVAPSIQKLRRDGGYVFTNPGIEQLRKDWETYIGGEIEWTD